MRGVGSVPPGVRVERFADVDAVRIVGDVDGSDLVARDGFPGAVGRWRRLMRTSGERAAGAVPCERLDGDGRWPKLGASGLGNEPAGSHLGG